MKVNRSGIPGGADSYAQRRVLEYLRNPAPYHTVGRQNVVS